MNKVKKLLSIILSVSILGTCLPVYAKEDSEEEVNETEVVLEAKDIELTSEERKEYEQYTEDLVSMLEEADIDKDISLEEAEETYSEIIKEYVENNSCEAYECITEQISDVIEENSQEEIVGQNEEVKVELGKEFLNEYEEEYVIDGDTSVVINPLFISIEQQTSEDEVDVEEVNEDDNNIANKISELFCMKVNAASKKTKSYSNSRIFYSLCGLKMFTIGMSCKFYYNGSKASYKSGFTPWYKRGTFSIWQVDNWSSGKGKSGSSYTCYCSGNFHWGAEVKGVGIVIQDYFIKMTGKCTKNGKTSTSWYIK